MSASLCTNDEFSGGFEYNFKGTFPSNWRADELILTELLFNNVFTDLTPQQCCALLSCLVFDEKSNENPKLTEELSGPLRQLQVNQ